MSDWHHFHSITEHLLTSHLLPICAVVGFLTVSHALALVLLSKALDLARIASPDTALHLLRLE